MVVGKSKLLSKVGEEIPLVSYSLSTLTIDIYFTCRLAFRVVSHETTKKNSLQLRSRVIIRDSIAVQQLKNIYYKSN